LHWEAGGVLSDKNGDDAYEWCYNYTVVFWNRNHIDFDDIPNDTDDPVKNYDLTFTKNNSSTSNAVHPLPGSFTDANSYGPPRAVLPRGYGMWWRSGDDHHVLHIGFDMGLPSTSGNTISWTSKTLLKDNSTARPYEAAALVSVLSGNSVRCGSLRVRVLPLGATTWREQVNTWTLTARSPSPCPSRPNGGSKMYHFIVEGVPFDYAVPMLSGWDVGNVCDDTHVKQVGVWMEDFDYVRDPNAPTGRMVYTIASVFEDEGNPQQSAERYKIQILGFNSLAEGSVATLP
jgi:hypothetical protein